MITAYADLSSIRLQANKSLVYIRGAFDVLHGGHADFIKFARAQGHVLVVGVISDEIIRSNKGSDRPLRPEQDRAYLVDAIQGVDYTFIVPPPQASQSSTELVLKQLRPDVFVLFDEKPAYTRHFTDLMEHYGVQLVLDNSTKKSSSSALIHKMKTASKPGSS